MGSVHTHGKSKLRAYAFCKGKRSTKVFDDRRDALKWIERTESGMAAGALESGGRVNLATPFRDLLNAEIIRLETKAKRTGKAESSVHYLRAAAQAPIGDLPIGQMQRADIKEYIAQRKRRRVARRDGEGAVKVGTLKKEITVMQSMVTRALYDASLSDEYNVFKGSQKALFGSHSEFSGETGDRTRVLSSLEIAEMLKILGYNPEEKPRFIKHYTAYAMLIALNSGMRLNEIITLEPHQLHLDGAHPFVSTEEGKVKNKASIRAVPAVPVVVQLLRQLPERLFEGMTASQISGSFSYHRYKAGLSGFTFHDTRRNALSYWAKHLIPQQLARLAGHATLEKLMIYYPKDVKEIYGAMAPGQAVFLPDELKELPAPLTTN